MPFVCASLWSVGVIKCPLCVLLYGLLTKEGVTNESASVVCREYAFACHREDECHACHRESDREIVIKTAAQTINSVEKPPRCCIQSPSGVAVSPQAAETGTTDYL